MVTAAEPLCPYMNQEVGVGGRLWRRTSDLKEEREVGCTLSYTHGVNAGSRPGGHLVQNPHFLAKEMKTHKVK